MVVVILILAVVLAIASLMVKGLLYLLCRLLEIPTRYSSYAAWAVLVVGLAGLGAAGFEEYTLRAEFKHVCETQAINKIYDQEAYEIMNENLKKNKYPRLSGEDLAKIKEQIGFVDKQAFMAMYDKDHQYLFFATTERKRGIDDLYRKIINTSNGNLIYETLDFYGYGGGWLCRLWDIDSPGTGCGFRTCEYNQYGSFKNTRSVGARF